MTTVDALRFEGIEKRFFGVPVLRGVSFAVPEGSVTGLVGENGAGKSTLMNVLGGVVPADAGRMSLRGESYRPRDPADARTHGVAFIHQELNLFTNLSVAENISIAAFPARAKGLPFVDRRATRERAARHMKTLDLQVAPDTPVGDLSPGERQMVEICKALSLDARVIIFDEPTTSLTAKETARLFEVVRRLRADGVAMIYISHALEHVAELCDQIVVLRDGAVVGSGARAEFSAERMIRLMVGRDLDQLYPPREEGAVTSSELRLEVRALSQPGVVRDINFGLRRGEILGVAGLMGSGRTELARILFGLDSFERGEIFVDGRPLERPSPAECISRGMAFLTEDRREEGLLMGATIGDNIGLIGLRSFARRWSNVIDDARLKARAGEVARAVRLDERAQFGRLVRTLSGGNQQKVVLAKWLLGRPAVFVMDEPTRGIDVGAKFEIYRTIQELADGGAGVIVISSEIEELIGVCDRILVMSGGEICGRYDRAQFDREEILRAALAGRGSPPSTSSAGGGAANESE